MFFHFSQNNSGGSFIEDDRVGGDVIIEADCVKDANKRAVDVGLYFNGCEAGYDCPCCGDRWYELWENEEGTELPEIYGQDATKMIAERRSGRLSDMIHIYYKDGRHVWFDGKEVKSE